MALEVLRIRVTESGSRRAAANINRVSASASQVAKDARQLQSALGGAVAALGARELSRAADTYTNLGNRIRVFADNSAQAVQRQAEVIRIANESRTPLDTVATLYQRLTIAGRDYGLTTEQLSRITEALTKSVATSGATAQEADGGLRQLAQGLAANRFSGQEFNSVAEQIPAILDSVAIATGKSTSELRGLANQGAFTARVLIESFLDQADTIGQRFERLTPTIGQATTVAANAVVEVIGKLSEASGASAAVARGILDISAAARQLTADQDRLNEVLDITRTILEAIALAALPRVFATLVGLTGSLLSGLVSIATLRPLAGLLGASRFLLGPLGALAGAAFLFRDSLIQIGDREFAVRDLATAVVRELQPAIDGILASGQEIANVFFGTDVITAIDNLIKASEFAGKAIVINLGLDGSFLDVLARRFRSITDGVLSISDAARAAASGNLELAGQELADGLFRGLSGRTSRGLDDVLDTLRTQIEGQQGLLAGLFGGGGPAAGSLLDRVLANAERIRMEREAAAAAARNSADATTEIPIALRRGNVELDVSEKALSRIARNLERLRADLDPTGLVAAQNEAIKATDTINQSFEAGLISSTELFELQTQVFERLRTVQEEVAAGEAAGSTGIQAVIFGARDAFRTAITDIGAESDIFSTGIQDGFALAEQSILDFAKSGEFNLKSFARSALDIIQQVIIRLLLLKALQFGSRFLPEFGGADVIGAGLSPGASSVGGILTGLNPGGGVLLPRANGGFARGGGSFLVGEQGPEVITPAVNSFVTPNDQLGGGGAPGVTIVNVTSMDQVAEALNAPAGEAAVLNIIERNSEVIRERVA